MVAMPFKLGAFRRAAKADRPARKGARFGIRSRLFMAFAGIAAMALVISGGASVLLGQLGRMMDDLSGVEIPRLTTALQIATLSETLVSRGPALLQAPNETVREEQVRALKATHAEAMSKIAAIRRLGADPTIVNSLEENTINIGLMVDNLAAAAKQRIETIQKRDDEFAKMRKAHNVFLSIIASALTISKADVNLALLLGSGQKEATDAMRLAEIISNLLADENSIVADLSATPSAISAETLELYKVNFRAASQRMQEGAQALGSKYSGNLIKDTMMAVLAFGEGKESIFSLRGNELQAAEFNELTLEETRKFSVGMEAGVKQLVAKVQGGVAASTDRAHNLVSFSTLVMIVLGVATLIGSGLFVWLYVGRNILRRIANLQLVMKRLAEGDLEAEVAASRSQDEVAEMARSLEVFRENMIQARELSTEQEKDRNAKAERSGRIETMIAGFEATVRSALDTLIASANAMQATAEGMSVSADKSSALSSAVASAAEETSVNVQTVSSGTEELSSSIAEISRQVANSTAVAGKAVSEAGETDATMHGLAECASRISTVVDLIQTIASQTNLLALNATIEAARAGESGRGFAVVASEVKSLADQTAKATDEIRSQIITMQNVATSAVGAIRHIGETIGEINEVTTAIAAAVEEQGAATREIARNIQHAASGTSEVSSNIIGVSQASADAGHAAAEVLTASSGLRREANMLRQEIDGFLANIRAA